MTSYSHSKLSTFEACPLKYRYCYVDKVELEKRPENIEAFMGKRVHETLCRLYSDLLVSKYDTREDLLAYYDEAWGKKWDDNVQVVRKERTPESYREAGRKCASDYYDRYQPFEGEKTLGLEQFVSINISGYKLVGYIDRLAYRGDGKYEIHDYKTSSGLPSRSFFDSDRQLALYQIGVGDTRKDAEQVDLVWHYLLFDREVRSRRTPEMLDGLKDSVIATIRRIEDAEQEYDFPAQKSQLCGWCEYRSLCPCSGYKGDSSAKPLDINETSTR